MSSTAASAHAESAAGNGDGSSSNGRIAGGIPGTVPVSLTATGSGRSQRRQPTLDDDSALKVIRQLDTAAPTGRASRLEIQKRLGCGGSRAARLADLARKS